MVGSFFILGIGWQPMVGQSNKGACHVQVHVRSSAFNHSDYIWAANELADRDDTLLISLSPHLNSTLNLCCCHLFSLSRCLSMVAPHFVWHLVGLFPTLVELADSNKFRSLRGSTFIVWIRRELRLPEASLSLPWGMYMWDTGILTHMSHMKEILTVGHLFCFIFFLELYVTYFICIIFNLITNSQLNFCALFCNQLFYTI